MTGITISMDIVQTLIGNKGLSNSAFRVLLYLMTNHQPVSTADISAAVGISQKAVCKSIRRLTDAGILQAGELEARRRRFNIPGAAIPDGGHEPVPDKDDTVNERMVRMEAAIVALTETISTLKAPVTIQQGADTAPAGIGSGVDVSANVPVEIPSEGTPIISLAKQACSFKESIAAAAEFKELFGVAPPVAADMLAVQEMVNRKKAGKLADLKSPLAYLASISGKVTGPTFTTPAVDSVPVQCSDPADDMAIRHAINQLWAKMTDEELEPYRQKAREKHQIDGHNKKVPLELLTRQIFNNEQLAAYR